MIEIWLNVAMEFLLLGTLPILQGRVELAVEELTWFYVGMSVTRARVGHILTHNRSYGSVVIDLWMIFSHSSKEATLRILLGAYFILEIWQLVKL